MVLEVQLPGRGQPRSPHDSVATAPPRRPRSTIQKPRAEARRRAGRERPAPTPTLSPAAFWEWTARGGPGKSRPTSVCAWPSGSGGRGACWEVCLLLRFLLAVVSGICRSSSAVPRRVRRAAEGGGLAWGASVKPVHCKSRVLCGFFLLQGLQVWKCLAALGCCCGSLSNIHEQRQEVGYSDDEDWADPKEPNIPNQQEVA